MRCGYELAKKLADYWGMVVSDAALRELAQKSDAMGVDEDTAQAIAAVIEANEHAT